MPDFTEIIKVNQQIIADIKKEERLQGHRLTLTLENSMQATAVLQSDTLILEGLAAAYIQELEERTPASDINISEQERQQLIAWVIRRGLAGGGRELKRLTGGSGTYRVRAADAEQIADAIIRKWEKEGRPTENSKQYSSTGERTGAIERVLERNDEKIFESMSAAIDKVFEPVFAELQNEEV